jgi:hypothetical protein
MITMLCAATTNVLAITRKTSSERGK